MPDASSSDDRAPVPPVVDVLSVETVDPLVARHEQELAALRRQLAEAEREAAAAEESLRRHPAASIFDDAFEAAVLAQVTESLSTVTGMGEQGAADGGRGAAPAPPVGRRAPVSSQGDPLSQTRADRSGQKSGPGSSAAPRTVVVQRRPPGPPRTVVVDRGRASSAAPPPPPSGPSVLAGDPGAAQFVNAQANAEVRTASSARGRKRKSKGNLLARVPARVLIQTGVIVVIVALLLLKLA